MSNVKSPVLMKDLTLAKFTLFSLIAFKYLSNSIDEMWIELVWAKSHPI